MRFRFIAAFFITILINLNAYALELPFLIDNGMVMQRDEPIPVWGWAEPDTEVKVVFKNKTQTVVANEYGKWLAYFPKQKAGGPHSLTVESGDEKFSFDDILVGDVWICSGQSNMEWPLIQSDNAAQAIAAANDKLIRHFKVPKSWASSPQDKLQGGEWQVSSPETAGNFTAVGYFFAKHLRENVDIPIGLINSSWGGSNIEAWMDAPLLGIDRAKNQKTLEALEESEALEAEKVKRLIARWPDALDDNYKLANSDWSAEKFDTNDWLETVAPAYWEKGDFAGMDGVAWYRKSFTLNREQSMQDLELGLARIDDHDVTWVNGHKVGETKKYNAVRKYKIDKAFLHEGANTIAVRVLDTGGGGGIYSEPELLYIRGPKVNLSLAGSWFFKVEKGSVSLASERNHTPTALYNKMLHPLFNTPVKGVLWYQGESNANNTEQAQAYREQFKDMILNWRSKWKNKKLPFYWVQLANFISGQDTETSSPWAILRESQTATLALPHTGQAVIIDVGNPNDIHPRDKQTVGERLARIALKSDYRIRQISTRGPHFKKAKVKGNTVHLVMQSKINLVIPEGEELLGFELAGADGKWHPAKAKINKRRIDLTSEAVNKPLALRYAWSDNPEKANLRDAAGLPAEPFRKLDL